MRRLIFMALAGVLCIFFGSAARAQRLDGTLRVTITDKSQASIEDAKVMAENQATGVSATTTTSSSGTYVFPNLLVGRRPIDLHNLAARVIVPQLKLCAACNEPESAHPNGHEFSACQNDAASTPCAAVSAQPLRTWILRLRRSPSYATRTCKQLPRIM